MKFIRWLIVAGTAWLAGLFLVRYLTVHPLEMSRYLALFMLSGFALLVVTIIYFRWWQWFIAAPIAFVLFMGGYCVQTDRFLKTPDLRTSPELTRQPGDPGKGFTAVVYFTHGEPETYDPIGWINQFREFDEQKIAFVPFLIRPIFAAKLREGYLRVGRSNHVFVHKQMVKALERSYRERGDTTTRFYLSFLDAAPTPQAAVVQALNDGASRIIVAEVFLTVSNHTAEGENQIKELGVEEKYGIPVVFTTPLYNSETLKRMFLERANAHAADIDRSKVGILLVGHGQPDEWDKEWPTETEHEMSFRNGVLDMLAANGYRRENLSLAWMQFKQPHPAPKVEEFVKNGVERVLYFAAAISADAMHSQYDIPEQVHEAKVPASVQLLNMGAWNDDPLVIKAIEEKVDEGMAALKAANR